jgi:hypothetical protein
MTLGGLKLGAENSKKTIVAGALFLVALVMFIRMISGTSSSPAPAAAPVATAPVPAARTRTAARRSQHGKNDKNTGPITPSLDPRLHLAELKEAEETEYDGTGRNIFVATAEQIPAPQGPGLTNGHATATPPPPPGSMPNPGPQHKAINLKFFGFASGPDHKRVFLSQGDDVIVASEGDIVERRYKIVKINNTSIDVLDVLSNDHQTIPLTAG